LSEKVPTPHVHGEIRGHVCFDGLGLNVRGELRGIQYIVKGVAVFQETEKPLLIILCAAQSICDKGDTFLPNVCPAQLCIMWRHVII